MLRYIAKYRNSFPFFLNLFLLLIVSFFYHISSKILEITILLISHYIKYVLYTYIGHNRYFFLNAQNLFNTKFKGTLTTKFIIGAMSLEI